MGIGVENRVAKDHLEVDVGGAVYQRVDVPACCLDGRAVGQRAAGYVAHGEDSVSREFGVGSWEHNVVLGMEVHDEPMQIVQLLREVDSVVHHLCEVGNQM